MKPHSGISLAYLRYQVIPGKLPTGSLPSQIVSTYNLVYNATLLVEAEIGCALCRDEPVNTGQDSNLLFIPLEPKLGSGTEYGLESWPSIPRRQSDLCSRFRQRTNGNPTQNASP